MRLILTTSDSGGGALKVARPDDIVIPFGLSLSWGRLPSEAQLANLLAAPSTLQGSDLPGWLRVTRLRYREEIQSKGLGLIDFCATCDVVELWVDPFPDAQLMLIWLLSCFRAHDQAAARLTLLQTDVVIAEYTPEEVAKWRLPAVKITSNHLETANVAWQAYRASNPQGWFNLLAGHLGVLPQLRPTVLGLLEELPWRATGLGATEMRLLEFISRGEVSPNDVFRHFLGDRKQRTSRVFGFWELGEVLDGLGRCPVPAVSGFEGEPFSFEMYNKCEGREKYRKSKLSLTPLGKAILVGKDDFVKHNPIHRWWGGTELTNDRLWRWDPETKALVAP
jgi:hypothetical protein